MSITIHRAQKRIELCTNLSLVAAHEEAVRQMASAEADNARVGHTLADPSPELTEAAKKVKKIEQSMEEATLLFTLEAVDRKTWNEYLVNHPPREGDEQDTSFGVNVAELDQIIPAAITAVENKTTAAEVPFNPSTEWPPLAETMSVGQWEQFALAVLQLNAQVGFPKLKSASLVTASSAKN